MKIIICGAGQVGTSIARQLSREENDVTIIDQSEELINKIGDMLDVKTVHGFASHPTVLEEAGAGQADMIIAVTASDEVNMVVCQLSRSLFNIPVKIARIRHQNYLQVRWRDLYRQEHLPIDVIISPEIEVARALNHRLHVPGAIDTVPFADGRVKVVAVRCTMDSPFLNISIQKLRDRLKRIEVSIMGVVRDGNFLLTRDRETLMPGDEVFFATESRNVPQAMELFGHEEKEARRLIIIGGGNVGLYLAEQLEQEEPDISIKIIELHKERAEYIAQRLSRTSVICGNALEQEILEEANVSSTETCIAISNDDEVNILSSLLAKRFGCKRAVTLINRLSYSPLISSLGIDVVVNPRETTVSSILQHIRRGKIRNVHSVCNGKAEIIEAEAVQSSPVVGKTVKELDLPSEVIVGVVLRGEHVLMPSNETVIQANDRIIMLCMAQMIKNIERIFSVKFEYF